MSAGYGLNDDVLQIAAQFPDPGQGDFESALARGGIVPHQGLLPGTEVPAADPGAAQAREEASLFSKVTARRVPLGPGLSERKGPAREMEKDKVRKLESGARPDAAGVGAVGASLIAELLHHGNDELQERLHALSPVACGCQIRFLRLKAAEQAQVGLPPEPGMHPVERGCIRKQALSPIGPVRYMAGCESGSVGMEKGAQLMPRP